MFKVIKKTNFRLIFVEFYLLYRKLLLLSAVLVSIPVSMFVLITIITMPFYGGILRTNHYFQN